jgi:hypothetical protein
VRRAAPFCAQRNLKERDTKPSKMLPDITVVTACYCLSRFSSKCRDVQSTMENMQSLLAVPCYLVIYSDSLMYPLIRALRTQLGMDSLTKYVVREYETLWAARYTEKIISNRAAYHPTKDERTCAQSHVLCCSKFEFVQQTMEDNPFGTTKFAWIDSNVGKNFSKICTGYTNNMLMKILYAVDDAFHIQVIGSVDKKYIKEENWREYYQEYRWVVAGSFFTTGRAVGMSILSDLKDEFHRHTEAGFGHAEEMLYLRILSEHAGKIRTSYGDYRHILNNFCGVTEGVDFIYCNFVVQSLDKKHFQECIDCCSHIVQQYANFSLDVDYNLFFRAYFALYLATYYHHGREKAAEVVKTIFSTMQSNPLFWAEYYRQKDFYDAQFKFALADNNGAIKVIL